MSGKSKMTPEEFDALRPRLGRLSLDTVALAREVLVDGRSQVDVAKGHGITKQRVSGMVARVIDAAHDVPATWQRVEVWVPPELVDQVRQLEAQARAALQERNTGGKDE